MKVIDLLNKIANTNKKPRFIYNHSGIVYQYIYDEINKEYRTPDNSRIFIFKPDELNCEIGLLEDIPKEDNKIEKLNIGTIVDDELQGLIKSINVCNKDIQDKLNEIIDKVNGEENERN